MHVIISIDENTFELNGTKYIKNYISRVFGNKLEIFNCYEKADVLVPQSGYENFTVNNQTFTNASSLQAALLDILFTRNSLDELIFPDATTVSKGKIQLAGDLSGTAATPVVPALNLKLPIETPAATGNVISFSQDKIYGSLASPISGNITTDLTAAKFGVTNMVIHNAAAIPTFEARFKKYAGSQNYIPGKNNFIYMIYLDSNTINYSIQQTL